MTKKINVVELDEAELEQAQGGLLPGFDEVEIDGGPSPSSPQSGDDPLQGWSVSPIGV